MLTKLEPVHYQAVQTGVYNHSYACPVSTRAKTSAIQ